MDENEGDDEGGIMVKALVYKYAPLIHFFVYLRYVIRQLI